MALRMSFVSPRRVVFLTLLVLTAAVTSMPAAATAAEVTDVLDAFDAENDNPYDLSLRIRFGQDSRSSTIAREWRCLAADQLGAEKCATGSTNLFARELTFERTRQMLNFDLRVGVYKDAELVATFPLVLSDSWKHDFAPGVGRGNSTLYPDSDKMAIVGVPYASTDRSGFGDMVVGLKWSPYNYYRETAHPTWVFSFMWTAPTGTPMEAGNDAVGEGLHHLELATTISRRTLGIVEPFFNIHGILRLGSAEGLFVKKSATQKTVDPGAIVGTQFGAELIPWEDLKADARVEFEIGFGMDYVFAGREYTEIWEALASPDNPCRPENGCSNTLNSKSAVDPATSQLREADGITDVEQYGKFRGWASLHYQPMRNFQISASFLYATESPHYITAGAYGTDLDGNAKVEQSNSKSDNEYSPTFLPALDTPGSRLRIQDVGSYALMVSVSGKL